MQDQSSQTHTAHNLTKSFIAFIKILFKMQVHTINFETLYSLAFVVFFCRHGRTGQKVSTYGTMQVYSHHHHCLSN